MDYLYEDTTWAKLKSQLTFDPAVGLIFRGMPDVGHDLVSSFHRCSRVTGLTLKQYVDRVLPEVRFQLADLLPQPFDLDDEHEFELFLAVLQHHGFPTPLLDWTMSPFVAAYFAFRDVDPNNAPDHVRIWMLSTTLWRERGTSEGSLKEPEPFVRLVRVPPRHNPRLLPQQALFTLSNAPDIGAAIRAVEDGWNGNRCLYSFRLSAKERPQVMNDLALMGLNERSMFPGLDGACRSLREHFLVPRVVGPTATERMKAFLEKFKTPKAPENPA